MKCFVGTSGWSYAWNRKRNLLWYVENTPFNTVELNASFYRFPYKSYVKSWQRIGERGLRFSIKAHRLITHVYRFGDKSFEVWDKLKELFAPLDEHISFYLFQLPPSLKPEKKDDIRKFIDYTGLGRRFALEFRNMSWYSIPLKEFLDVTLVSVSAPRLPEVLPDNGQTLYMRFHGKINWYRYDYSRDELIKIYRKVRESDKINEAYFYFNNDTAMFENAIEMSRICGL